MRTRVYPRITAALLFYGLLGAARAGLADTHLSVASDGTGQYTTLQAAVDAVPAGNTQRYIIDIKPGTYTALTSIPSTKPFITFRGQNPATTILSYNLGASDPPNDPFVHASTVVQGKDFIAENVSFQNTKGQSGGQALAIYIKADRAVFNNCRFLGWQDTLRSEVGRHYFKNCYIEGSVDFIYGKGQAYFDRCTTYSKASGYVTAQARESASEANGFVFHDCDITGNAANDSVTLGRPWQAYARVIYDSCDLATLIAPSGWSTWSGTNNHLTAYFAEYNSTGAGAAGPRVSWAYQLTAQQVQAYSLHNWLSGTDNWNPVTIAPDPGDADYNSIVDVNDLALLAAHWHTAGSWAGGDFNADGFIDEIDLGILAKSWPSSGGGGLGAALEAFGLPVAAVPEPGSAAVVLCSLLAMARRCRRDNERLHE